VKIINKKLINNEDSKRMYREIEILKKLDHPNIVKVLDFFDDKNNMYIVTELCTGGQLFE
jgi:calcium-dependent protein kinase